MPDESEASGSPEILDRRALITAIGDRADVLAGEHRPSTLGEFASQRFRFGDGVLTVTNRHNEEYGNSTLVSVRNPHPITDDDRTRLYSTNSLSIQTSPLINVTEAY
jgi:hypothetical protein